VQEDQPNESSNLSAMALTEQVEAAAVALLENQVALISKKFERIRSNRMLSIPSSLEVTPFEEFKPYESSIEQARNALSNLDGSNFPTQVQDVFSLTADQLEMASGLTKEIESY
jgi:hypothetical protein